MTSGQASRRLYLFPTTPRQHLCLRVILRALCPIGNGFFQPGIEKEEKPIAQQWRLLLTAEKCARTHTIGRKTLLQSLLLSPLRNLRFRFVDSAMAVLRSQRNNNDNDGEGGDGGKDNVDEIDCRSDSEAMPSNTNE